MLGPVLGVGAAVAGGAAAVFGRMMTGCPRSRPCPVGFPIHFYRTQVSLGSDLWVLM